MAGDDERERICTNRASDGTGGLGLADGASNGAVRARGAKGYCGQFVPHGLLKRRAVRSQWQIERATPPGEVLGELLLGTAQKRRGSRAA
jgi:hypothetical protein